MKYFILVEIVASFILFNKMLTLLPGFLPHVWHLAVCSPTELEVFIF